MNVSIFAVHLISFYHLDNISTSQIAVDPVECLLHYTIGVVGLPPSLYIVLVCPLRLGACCAASTG